MNYRQLATRRAFAAFWMTLYGAAASSVAWWALWPALVSLVLWLMVTLGLGLIVAVQFVRISKQPRVPVPPRRFDRRLARNIAAVIAVYTLAEAVAALLLHAAKLDRWIFPVAVGVAGLHFWLFALVLGMWQYYVTGVLDCLAAAGTVVLVSPDTMVGPIHAWIFYPLLGGGAALYVTAGLLLYESVVLVRAGPTPPV